MGYKVDFGVNIKFTDEDGIHVFNEGDNVVCHTSDGNAFVGKITFIGNCRQNKDAGSEPVICLDTFKSERNYPGEVIKVKDITYICSYPLYGANGFPDAEEAELRIELTKKWYSMSVKAFEVLAGIYNETIADGVTDMPRFSDVLELVTENMEHLLGRKKIRKLIEGAKETVAK